MNFDETRITRAAPRGRGVPEAALLVLHSEEPILAGRRFEVREDDVTIGRDAGSTVCIPADNVSRSHARIFRSGTTHVLVDAESTNGTLLNGRTVDEATLRDGDVIRVGSTVLKYVAE
jgi:pSer/pThr/pTyr-binding forkhead associated (FHA) protein